MESLINNEGGSSAEQINEAENQHDDHNNISEHSESQEESQFHNEDLQCRFYRKDFPDENDIVIVSIPLSRNNFSLD